MADIIAKGEKYEKEADKKIHRWLGPKYKDAVELYDTAANCYNLSCAWDKAAAVYLKLAGCHLILDSKHEAASAYADAANKYKEISVEEAITYFAKAVNLFLEICEFNMAAICYKEIGVLYEVEQHIQKSISYYEQAAEYFYLTGVTIPICDCLEDVARLLAKLDKYPEATQCYVRAAQLLLDRDFVRCVKDYLFSAGLCHFHTDDIDDVSRALEKYKEMDPTFSGTPEYKFLADLVASYREEDVQRFKTVIRDSRRMIIHDYWKIKLLFGVEVKLKKLISSSSLEKVAQLFAQMKRYADAINLYEDAAKKSLNDNLLKYRVKDYLLSAGLCRFHKDDIGAVSYALEQYKEMDPTFLGTPEYKFLAALVVSVGTVDFQGFNGVVEEFRSMITRDAWKITLLLRVKQNLKHKRLYSKFKDDNTSISLGDDVFVEDEEVPAITFSGKKKSSKSSRKRRNLVSAALLDEDANTTISLGDNAIVEDKDVPAITFSGKKKSSKSKKNNRSLVNELSSSAGIGEDNTETEQHSLKR